ncbi:MAG TPA: tRNA lysidine(34) synthetase TilS [Candidatus Binataceae bacterium]|nr:tRNA lysidine(34) synthetase TilS [Candidatus Binataceae bacterium]
MDSAAKSTLLRKIGQALEQAGLRADDLILLALSGGPDSVALLHALRELRPRLDFRLAAAHLNHRLRGAESDRDEAFVRKLCAEMGVELVVERARGLDPAASNLEERARRLRYEFLVRAARRLGAGHVATAHHADDQAETVMLRLLRGAGASGLGAMAPVDSLRFIEDGEPRPLTLVRPMLRIQRQEIEHYLESVGARFVSDSSNQYPDFLRNRVRGELLPALERDYAPSLRGRLAALADEMRDLDDFVAQTAAAELERRMRAGVLLLDGFAGLAPTLAAALLRAYLAIHMGNLRGISRRHLEALRRLCLGESPSAAIDLPGRWRAGRRYRTLAIERASNGERPGPSSFSVPLAREGITEVAPARFTFHSTVTPADVAPLPTDLFEACFDADAAEAGLVARAFTPGDRIAPLGIAGTRKLQDVFVDRKLARARRRNYPVVTLAGEVAWLPGLARGRVALIGPLTRQVLRVRARNIEAGA